MRPKVIVALAEGSAAPEELARLELAAEPLFVRTAGEYLAAARESDILLVWDLDCRLLQECGPGKLRWIQTNSIGVNAVATPDVARAGVTVTNVRGVFERPIAEFVLAAILFQAKEMRRGVEDQRRGVWQPRPSRLLDERRALVVGAGGVGRRTVELLRAVGMRADLMGRTRRPDAEFGLVHGFAELRELLPHVDDLVLAAPLTDETRRMIGEREFEVMRPWAHLVNVGRGALVDEPALVTALRAGDLGAATLDVFEREPLAQGHPFWEMENVFLSPHRSASFVGWREKVVELFLRNLDRWRTGERLEHIVDLSAFVLGRPEAGEAAPPPAPATRDGSAQSSEPNNQSGPATPP